MKILIVDNDRDTVEMLTSWLKTLGYEVYRAYTGERAKVEWEAQKPDLVILDTTLKDTDALAMCRELRHLHETFSPHGVPSMGLSLDDDPEAWDAALKRSNLPWSHGRLGKGAGVSVVPAYWLLDPNGKILVKATEPEEVAKYLAEQVK